MGASRAMEFAHAVGEGTISLETAVRYHLTANHYPPLPAALVPTAIRAIGKTLEALRCHELGEAAQERALMAAHITLEEGIEFRGRDYITVIEAIEAMHLDGFVVVEYQGLVVEGG